jgi:hypothetical protein
MKKPQLARKHCHTCEGTKDEMKSIFTSEDCGVKITLRDPNNIKIQASLLGTDPTQHTDVQASMSTESGIRYYSELWNWPGVFLCSALVGDLMHCEVEGEMQKHFTLYMRSLKTSDKACWKVFSNHMQLFCQQNNVSCPGRFASEASF